MIAAIPVLHVPPLLAPLPVTSVRYSMVCASASPDQALINREIAKTIEYLNELDSGTEKAGSARFAPGCGPKAVLKTGGSLRLFSATVTLACALRPASSDTRITST
jgi:hypothetical protein